MSTIKNKRRLMVMARETRLPQLTNIEDDEGMVIGIPKIDQENKWCESCMVGKQTRKPLPNKTSYRAS